MVAAAPEHPTNFAESFVGSAHVLQHVFCDHEIEPPVGEGQPLKVLAAHAVAAPALRHVGEEFRADVVRVPPAERSVDLIVRDGAVDREAGERGARGGERVVFRREKFEQDFGDVPLARDALAAQAEHRLARVPDLARVLRVEDV